MRGIQAAGQFAESRADGLFDADQNHPAARHIACAGMLGVLNMGYKTILVHLELGRSNEGLLAVAGALADKLSAGVIGVAACQPVQILYDETYVSGEILAEDRKEIKMQIDAAEQQFRKAFDGHMEIIDWRTSVGYSPLCDYIADQARAADLIVTGTDIGGSVLDSTRRVNIADLVMQAGRPVMIVPGNCTSLALGHVMVGWKETREARLAILEALPLLKRAGQVSVVEIASSDETALNKRYVKDVVAWLKRHDIGATAMVIPAKGDDGQRLAGFASENGADLLVAGAYGHSRAREWALGGVTKDFLLRPNRCVLLAH
jgi:nucleotide-binding universal stress UspA family protein